MPVRLRLVSGVALVAVLTLTLPATAGAQTVHDSPTPRLLSETTSGRHFWVGMHVAAAIRDRWLDAQALLAAKARADAAVRDASRARHPTARRTAGGPETAATPGSGRCGGDLPPCYVMMRESRGSLTAENPVSSASGKWQFVDGTWDGYGGYSHASDAPESVQDARAREVWAGGSGCSNWSAC